MSKSLRFKALTCALMAFLLLGSVLSAFPLAQPVCASSTETLRPDATGDFTEITAYPTGANWARVNEASSDNWNTYVWTVSPTNKRDLYNLPASSGSGTINFVKIYFLCAEYNPSFGISYASPSLKSDSTVTYGSEVEITTTYPFETHSQTWATNPADSEAWEWSDIDNLQIGVSLRTSDPDVTAIACTQLYVEVDYTPPVEPSVTTDAATSVEETTATLNGNVTAINDTSITERGFVWDTSDHGDPGNVAPASSGYASNWTETDSFGTGSFNHGITSLTKGELYYFRACAENDDGNWGYGSELTFLTKPDPPSTFTATSGGETQIDLAWTNGTGSQKVYIRGKLGSAPTNRTDGAYSWNGTGTETSHAGLSGGQHWYYIIWSYATEGALEQTSDTPDLSDDATTVTPPTVTSLQVEGTGSYIFGRWVILRGQVANDQGLAVDEVGFEYGLTGAYGSSVNQSGDWNTGDEFVLWVGVLSQGTTYHWRAYATDGEATGFGSDMYFTTEGSDSLYEYLNTGQDGDSDNIYAANWTAQYFTTDSTAHTITTINLYLKRVLSPGTITVSLKHADDSHKPTGADLCSGTYNGDNISTAYGWVEFDVDDISLEASTEYAIVVRAVAGDGSNYVVWGEDAGGGLADAYGWHSTDGGVSWITDSPADYLFEIWGNPVLAINTAAVFRGYLDDDDDDMLFVLDYENIYPPYYPDYDCPTYFSLRLYGTDGTTLLKSTACRAWGNKPGAIYVSGEEAVALTPGSAFYLKLMLNSDASVVASYQLQSVDWKGWDLTTLDRWVITTAHSIETYYYDVLGVVVDLTEFAGGSEVLNEEGGIIFATGIPALSEIRPDLFKVVIHIPSHEDEDWTNAFVEATDWEVQVGPTAANVLTAGGGFIGMDGKMFGTFILLGIYMLGILIVVGKGAGSRGSGFIGAGLAIPILIAGTWLRLLDVVFISVLASIAVVLLVYSLWWART